VAYFAHEEQTIKAARMLKRIASFFVVFLSLGAAHARECDVTIAEQATVAAVADGGSFQLTDGRHVKLAGIEAPRPGWPLAEEARANLAKLLEGKSVDLGYADRGTDRHGDLLAYAFVGDVWLQAEQIDGGFARAYSRSDTRRCAAALLKREADARMARRGIWADAFYRIRKIDDLSADIGTFQIIEGKIVSVKVGRERAYLNFGADYRTDFTVTISARDLKRLAKDGIDPAKWNAKTVRVRGWVLLLNGPEIELTHAEQVELLD
jgi:endonuclease YncB( thermonuclease family)